MRIVAMADTHSSHKNLRVPEGDVLVHAGDLTDMGRIPQIREVLDWMRSQPHPHKIVIAGNHDFGFQNEFETVEPLLEGLTYLHDSGTEIDGLSFWGSPWQPYFGGWAFNLERGRPLAKKWELIPQNTGVLITHGPPHGFGDNVGYERVGCKDLKARIRVAKPFLHLFGHIHEDRGNWVLGSSRLFNVTTSYCELPCTVIDVDSTTREIKAIIQ